jgi:hypothetical protein
MTPTSMPLDALLGYLSNSDQGPPEVHRRLGSRASARLGGANFPHLRSAGSLP